VFFFAENDPRNLSEPLESAIATNQKAEIMAAIRALEQVKNDLSKPIEIRTDSKYTVQAMTLWIKNWQNNDDNSKILNWDLFLRLDELIKERKAPVYFIHVIGHNGDFGNEQANNLAIAASTQIKNNTDDELISDSTTTITTVTQNVRTKKM